MPYASSRDNVLDSVSYDHTGGLANCRAVTSWQLPGWNCLKHRKGSPARIWFAGERECRASRLMAKAVSADEYGYVCQSELYDVKATARQQRLKCKQGSSLNHQQCLYKRNPGNEIYSDCGNGAWGCSSSDAGDNKPEESRTPGLCRSFVTGREGSSVLGTISSNCTDGLQLRYVASVSRKTSIVQYIQLPGVDDEVCSKPQGKAAHERHGLKPYSRNETVRDFRGLGGNGCVAVFQLAGGMPRVCNEIRQYVTNCATIPLGYGGIYREGYVPPMTMAFQRCRGQWRKRREAHDSCIHSIFLTASNS